MYLLYENVTMRPLYTHKDYNVLCNIAFLNAIEGATIAPISLKMFNACTYQGLMQMWQNIGGINQNQTRQELTEGCLRYVATIRQVEIDVNWLENECIKLEKRNKNDNHN